MEREKDLISVLNNLNLLYNELNRIVVQYEMPIDFKYLSEWQLQKGKDHTLLRVVTDNQFLYINCCKHSEIYRYSFDFKLVTSHSRLAHEAYAMELINNQIYILNDVKFFLLDIKTNSIVMTWPLPKEKEGPVGGLNLKIDQDKIYFTPSQEFSPHHIYLYNIKTGKEIRKFGTREKGEKEAEFKDPAGVTVNKHYLYICDKNNHRLQILDKLNGTFIYQWKMGFRLISFPRCILLIENLLYIGDDLGIQVFTKDIIKCIQSFGGIKGTNKGEFWRVTGFCFVEGKLVIVDSGNSRIQVWS